ncbi:MAG: SRPBCC domain-containing protein, partial [Kaistella sp.]
MKLLEYKIQINATPDRVWEVLFTQDADRNWPSAVNEGTYFEGTWEESSVMRFLDAENNGMYNLVEENIPNQTLKMKHLGWIY